jgi:hypothetical protein
VGRFILAACPARSYLTHSVGHGVRACSGSCTVQLAETLDSFLSGEATLLDRVAGRLRLAMPAAADWWLQLLRRAEAQESGDGGRRALAAAAAAFVGTLLQSSRGASASLQYAGLPELLSRWAELGAGCGPASAVRSAGTGVRCSLSCPDR